MISGSARLAGVIGHPVSHSRSPLLHNHWLARHGIDGAYVPLPVPPERLETALRGLRAAGFAGLNVTVPHKQAVAAFCDELDEAASRTGSVNTLVFTADGRCLGSSTDGAGFLASLRAAGVDARTGPVLLLGAGGAALALAASLLAHGIPVLVANRTRERSEALARRLATAAGPAPRHAVPGPGVRVLDWAAWPAALADVALLVNTTSLGMRGQPALPTDLSRAGARLVVADIVYVPLETALLAAARARGLRTVGGLGMLLHQAVPGFAAWFGVTPEVDDEVTALLASSVAASGQPAATDASG
ncbi:shikimate dehydrogenase [Lichenicoccus sp.]|uniref:shikimate dehydrogenase n=1 Tax=Lichenicoccus sp. TaxID=2781899 RepID=UPI003D10380A